MTEQEYLTRLEQALKDAPEEDRNEVLAFYRSYFQEGGTPVDTPEEAAERLLHEEKSTQTTTQAQIIVKKSNFGWKLLVLILTFPFWIGFLAAWFALLVTAWVVLIVVPIALAAGAVTSLFAGILYFSVYYPVGLQGIGWALVAAGLTLLCWKPCLLGIVGLWKAHVFLGRKFCRWMKKEESYETA